MNNIGIRNFRSFDAEGIFLPNLSKVNIIIGKNNSGKSNILRFVHELSQKYNRLDSFSFSPIDSHRQDGRHVALGMSFSFSDFDWPEILEDPVYRFSDIPLDTFIPNPFTVWLTLNDMHVQSKDLPNFRLLNDHQFRQLHKLNRSADPDTNVQTIVNIVNQKLQEKLSALRGLIYIPDLRIINPSEAHNHGNSEINGLNIIEKLFRMQNPSIGHERDRQSFDKLQKLVGSLLNSERLKIEIPYTKDNIIVVMHDNRLPLNYYGSGIYQLILLCAALIIYEDKWICIEEPETHLHPELQRKFLDFLVKETKNKYFITTHSNTFINYNEEVLIYHVEHNEVRSTVNQIINLSSSSKILDDLGYKASDLLQTNGIIWVEGPSDRNFLLQWLSMLNPELKEGLHFTIMFYGGKNLANVCFTSTEKLEASDFETNLVPLLKINRNACVIIDSDIFKNRTQINSTKTRIKTEIGDRNCWITYGKEIENYIPNVVVKRWLSSKNIFNGNQFSVEKNTVFSDLISSLDSSGKMKYAADKNFYSREIAALFQPEDLKTGKLREELDQLINKIKSWN